MTFLWQHCVFTNTSYLSQYIILLTTSFKASQENISPSVCSSAGITPTNTRIHHFAGVTTGKRQNVVFHIHKDSISDSVYTIFCSCYYSVGEANQYNQPYLDTSKTELLTSLNLKGYSSVIKCTWHRNSLKDYQSVNEQFLTPFYSKAVTMNGLWNILRNLHFSNYHDATDNIGTNCNKLS